MIASTGTRNASIGLKAAEERGVQVVHTGYTSAPLSRASNYSLMAAEVKFDQGSGAEPTDPASPSGSSASPALLSRHARIIGAILDRSVIFN
jgi:hypothetical protein